MVSLVSDNCVLFAIFNIKQYLLQNQNIVHILFDADASVMYIIVENEMGNKFR